MLCFCATYYSHVLPEALLKFSMDHHVYKYWGTHKILEPWTGHKASPWFPITSKQGFATIITTRQHQAWFFRRNFVFMVWIGPCLLDSDVKVEEELNVTWSWLSHITLKFMFSFWFLVFSFMVLNIIVLKFNFRGYHGNFLSRYRRKQCQEDLYYWKHTE